jgi:hypothetical protein
MKHLFALGFAVAATAFAAAPALAAVDLDENRCTSVLEADGGCIFFGNDNVANDIEAQYNPTGKAASPIDLNDVGKIDTPDDFDWSGDLITAVGKLTSADGGLSGTWELFDGYVADYISVKASNEFKLIKLAIAASSGTWSTSGLCTGGRNCVQPQLSHLQFFGYEGGDAVPEPATWAMLVGGFGLVGGALRRRKALASVSA